MPSQLKINTSDLQTLIEKANGLPPVLDTSNATAEAEDIVINETAYVNGVKITGTNPYEKTATDTEVNSQATTIAEIAELLNEKSVPSGGAVKTCTITITLDRSAELYVYGTLYSEGEISTYDANGQSPSAVYVFNNVVCGSALYINSYYYTTVPAYRLGGGVILLNKNNGAFQAPTEAGANGTIRIIDDD